MGKKVKIRIMRSGIYGADGQIPVGSTFTVDQDRIPAEWKNKIEIVSKTADDAEPVVNPASTTISEQAQAAKDAQTAADSAEAQKKAEDAAKAAAKKDDEDKAAAEKAKADDAAAQKDAAVQKLPGQK